MEVTRWEQGRAEIDQLLNQGRLERVSPNRDHAIALIEQAHKAILSAELLAGTDDTITAFLAAYDAARKALTAVLANQGLRPTGGEGGHAVLREAVLAQLEPPPRKDLRAFGWMRQVRNNSAYPDPERKTATPEELKDAITAAKAIITVAEAVIPVMPVYGQ
ncbi:MAG: HEPN domain-containing protein [Propionibacteriaceae bacterium]|jgi:HEPN domain-containing protein|nr:HEPN domain-containing protein [Propionibacteriaceae bacterium]